MNDINDSFFSVISAPKWQRTFPLGNFILSTSIIHLKHRRPEKYFKIEIIPFSKPYFVLSKQYLNKSLQGKGVRENVNFSHLLHKSFTWKSKELVYITKSTFLSNKQKEFIKKEFFFDLDFYRKKFFSDV